MIHTTSNKIKSWYQRGREGFIVGPALQHYQYIKAIDNKTKALIIIDTAEYLHKYLTKPHITAEDRMAHAMQFLTAALKDVPASICDSQLAETEAVRAIFTNGKTIKSIANKTSKAPLTPRQAAPERYRTPNSKDGKKKPTGHNFQGFTIKKSTQNYKNEKHNNKLSG